VTTNLSPYELARIAECASPDAPDSPGARFLVGIADAVEEAREGDSDIDDLAHEVADAAVPVYTHRLWMTFVDLGAYDEADEDGAAVASLADGNPSNYAGAMLYYIARRLAYRLLTNRPDAGS
jgi:hypothetical protein